MTTAQILDACYMEDYRLFPTKPEGSPFDSCGIAFYCNSCGASIEDVEIDAEFRSIAAPICCEAAQ